MFRNRRNRRNSSRQCNGTTYIEMGIINSNGDYDPNGELWDFANDRPIDQELPRLRPIFDKISDGYGELVIHFTADMFYDSGDRDTPPASGDERAVTNVYVKTADGSKIQVPMDMYDDIENIFSEKIYATECGGDNYDEERDYDDYDEERYHRRSWREDRQLLQIKRIAESIE